MASSGELEPPLPEMKIYMRFASYLELHVRDRSPSALIQAFVCRSLQQWCAPRRSRLPVVDNCGSAQRWRTWE